MKKRVRNSADQAAIVAAANDIWRQTDVDLGRIMVFLQAAGWVSDRYDVSQILVSELVTELDTLFRACGDLEQGEAVLRAWLDTHAERSRQLLDNYRLGWPEDSFFRYKLASLADWMVEVLRTLFGQLYALTWPSDGVDNTVLVAPVLSRAGEAVASVYRDPATLPRPDGLSCRVLRWAAGRWKSLRAEGIPEPEAVRAVENDSAAYRSKLLQPRSVAGTTNPTAN